MAKHVGGELQAAFMGRIRGLDPQRCLAMPVDVGKSSAMALVCVHYGEVVVEPFAFDLIESGFNRLVAHVARAEAEREAAITRVGVEMAGLYHRNLVARLR